MDKFIKAADLRRKLEVALEMAGDLHQLQYGLETAIAELDGMPEGIVRCQNCVHYDPECEFCRFWGGNRHPEHYCGEGELMDAAD